MDHGRRAGGADKALGLHGATRRCFDFTYRSLQKGKPADVYFSAKAVKRKLAELKAVLPPEVYDFPAHTPADEMAVMLPLYQQLADANGRQQVSRYLFPLKRRGVITSVRRIAPSGAFPPEYHPIAGRRWQWCKAIVLCRVSEIKSSQVSSPP